MPDTEKIPSFIYRSIRYKKCTIKPFHRQGFMVHFIFILFFPENHFTAIFQNAVAHQVQCCCCSCFPDFHAIALEVEFFHGDGSLHIAGNVHQSHSFSSVPPSGPAIPVRATATSALDKVAAPFTISSAVCRLTAPCF